MTQPDNTPPSPEHSRYSRQVRFASLGVTGQQRLQQARVFVCGCGALGSALAESMTRAGVGFLRLVDRDFVELSNLQRQSLYDEADARDRTPKAIAAAKRLSSINSTIEIAPVVADVTAGNLASVARDCDLWLDGTDNFETRFLLNDAALEWRKPWIYAGVVGSTAQTMTIVPGQTACLRCLMDAPPGPGATETCDTAGVIGPAIQLITALQAAAALRWLADPVSPVAAELLLVDVWERTWRRMETTALMTSKDCPACGRGERPWLRGERGSHGVVLCGRNSVQISPSETRTLDLQQLATDLAPLGTVRSNRFLVRLLLSPEASRAALGEDSSTAVEFHIFADGRTIVQGTSEPTLAKSLCARYLGL